MDELLSQKKPAQPMVNPFTLAEITVENIGKPIESKKAMRLRLAKEKRKAEKEKRLDL